MKFKKCTEAICLAPRKTISVVSAGKVMASVFWVSGIQLRIGYFAKGDTIG